MCVEIVIFGGTSAGCIGLSALGISTGENLILLA